MFLKICFCEEIHYSPEVKPRIETGDRPRFLPLFHQKRGLSPVSNPLSQSMALEFVLQGLAGDAQPSGGFAFVAVGFR